MDEKQDKYIKRKFQEISKKFNYVQESVNLGTLDNTVLALLIFVIAISFSFFSIGFEPFKRYPELFVWIIYALIMILPLFLAIYMYVSSIFIKERRFTNKRDVFLIIEGIYLFLGLLLIILFSFKFYETHFGQINPLFVKTIFWILVIGIPLYLIFYRKNQVWRYLKDNFPEHLRRREKEIKEIRKKKNG